PASYRPLAQLATWVEALLGVSVAVSFLAGLTKIHKTMLDGRVLGNPLNVSVSDLKHVYHRNVVLNRWALACVAVTGAVFLVWLYRAASNSRGAGKTTDPPGFVVGGWFIPVANLILPIVAVSRVLRASRNEPRRLLLGLWWAAYLAAGITAFVAGGGGDATLTDIHDADQLFSFAI